MSPRRFLDRSQARTLAAAADRIFPAQDESPSASELGVVEYVDGQLAGAWGRGDRLYRDGPFPTPADRGHGWQSPLTPAEAYRHGLAALDALARDRGADSFADLPPAARDEMLASCEAGAVEADFGPALGAAEFFELLRTNVLEGLFADPRYGGNRGGLGWRWLGFPEQRAEHGGSL